MSFEALLIHVLTVYRRQAGAVDRYGNEADDFAPGVDHAARVQQENSAETLLDRDTRVSVFTAFMLPTAEVGATDEAEWEGRRLRVVGEPAVLHDSIGPHHLEVVLEAIEE